MIYCVWYHSGGFGHYVNAILNSFGHNFVRPRNSLEFSADGNSHAVGYVAPRYTKNQDYYSFNFDSIRNYSVIVDNGINDESTNFVRFFPGAKVVKICYDDYSWPIVAATMITKAMKSNKLVEVAVNQDKWTEPEDWAQREKYFLFLRDHPLRYMWKSDNASCNLYIDNLLDYDVLRNTLHDLGIDSEPFKETWQQWFDMNNLYIDPIIKSNDMIQGAWHELSDVWSQAVFYYQVWCKYSIEVPHNDFKNFFTSYNEYRSWLEDAK